MGVGWLVAFNGCGWLVFCWCCRAAFPNARFMMCNARIEEPFEGSAVDIGLTVNEVSYVGSNSLYVCNVLCCVMFACVFTFSLFVFVLSFVCVVCVLCCKLYCFVFRS